MKNVIFSWDEKKAKSNLVKHRVSFDEASSVFLDENAIEFFDPDHSANEDRYLMLGISCKIRIILVSYCFRKSGAEIRIISARRAVKKEQAIYLERIL